MAITKCRFSECGCKVWRQPRDGSDEMALEGGGLENRGESGQRQLSPVADMPPQMLTAALCRYCCKSLFARVIKNSAGR